ncbi:Outer membrane cobalamin receptor protein [Mariniphaga anaerophila]|uniref:Outer membrane cobalamin receptor protein n=1 Tax=Mariniphaga anaerophila TaxID=1484053 RepID=A0A1M4TP53_9BACT|nr:TonB-dependent receptor plug domain-containing protein [Mariniphaga anaerophila]SHE46208.1 Outer membrane cobalamin receptor protein [Mariniphaga anaerophila]
MFYVKHLGIVVLLLAVTNVFSQSRLDSVQRLNEIVVIAKRYKEIIPAQTLKGAELEQLNSFSVADAIRFFSGVQIKDYGGVGGIKTVNIRSMGTNHMGVFYNGIQLGNAQNGQIDLGKFSLENVEEISLYNGQKSEIFQSAKEFGSAGSIYLTTKRPRFEKGKDTNVKASMRTGSFGLFNPSVLYEYKISEKINTTFNVEWINANGKYKFRYRRVTPSGELAYDTTATRQNGDIDAVRMEGSLNGYLESGMWKVHVYHYASERGIPGAIVNNVWRRGERLWDNNSFVQGVYQQDLTPNFSSKVNVKYAADVTHYINNDDKLIHVDNIYKQKEAYFSWANKYALRRNWDVSMAYDFQWNGLSEFVDVSRVTHWLSAATAFTVADQLKIQASILETLVNEEDRQRDDVPNKQVFTPAVFMSYQPFKKHEIVFRTFYKKSFRMPTFNDLYYTDMGNAFLRPEYAEQYNIGVLYDTNPQKQWFESFHFGVDAYYNYVKDKIVAYPKGQQFRWTMLNLGEVDIRGVDLTTMATFLLPKDLKLTGKLQYTYQEAIDITNHADTYYRHQIPYIPWHSGSAIAMLAWRNWSMNYSFIYVGERYNQQENIRYNYTQPWYTSDVSFSKQMKLNSLLLKFSAEINNLLSQDYDVILNYPMPKRNYRFLVSIEI